MNSKNKKIGVFVAIVLLSVSVFGIGASAATNIIYDSSSYAAEGNVKVSSEKILEEYLGEALWDEESEFFNTLSDTGVLETVEVAYNEIINTGRADVRYEGNSLHVSAIPYTYTGVNGKEFTWIPESVAFGTKDTELLKTSESYTGVIECAEPEKNEAIKITYRADVKIAAEDLNEILNLYRDTAEYAYNKSVYDAYLIEKKIYDDAVAKYDEYLKDVEEYEKLLDEYNSYESVTLAKYYEDLDKYQKYEVDKKEYDEKLAKYNAYMKEYSKIEKQLNAVKLIDVPMALGGRTVYGAIMGGAVDIVLDRQGDLVAAGAQAEAVALAGDATERVRNLMNEFKACKTDRDKYIYYTNNYENFCDSFLDLTQALDVLYRNRLVRAAIVAKDRNPQYVLLVAQLALISTALIDGDVHDYNGNVAYTSSWTIDGKTILKILENKTYFVDNDTAKPVEMPPEVKKPDDLVFMAKPTFPEEPECPVMPPEVSAPGNAPSVVVNPDLSLKHPAIADIYKAFDSAYRVKLKEAFEKNTLPEQRAALGSGTSFTMTLRAVMNKLYKAETVEVRFKIADGKYSTLTVDKNSPVVCEERIPSSYVDEYGDTWVLIGWGIEGENVLKSNTGTVDLALGFDKNTTLVPIYDHYYSVTWDVDGKLYTTSVSARENAVCPIPVAKADEGKFYYEFVGWLDESGNNVGFEIGKPTRDAKYTAAFDKKYIVAFSSTKGAEVSFESDTVVCDVSSYRGSSPLDISKLLERALEKQSAITLITSKGKLKFAFAEVLTLSKNKTTTVSVEYSGNATVDNYLIDIVDESGESENITVGFEAASRAASVEKYKLFKVISDTEKAYVRYTFEDQILSFEAQTGVKYVFRAEYTVRFAPNDLVEFSVSNRLPKLNEDIEYQIIPKDGVEVLEILIEDSDGNPIMIKEFGSKMNGELRVLGKDVNISVYARYKEYTVTFKSNGKNIYQQTVMHGEMPTPPTAPKLSDDGVYTYKFVGWSSEITPVTCEVVYEAVYEKIPLPPKEKLKLGLSEEVKKLLMLAAAAFVVFVGFVATLTTIVVRIVGTVKAHRRGFSTYAEYKSYKKLSKIDRKVERLREKLRFEAKNPMRSWRKIKKAERKQVKARRRLDSAKKKGANKELKRLERKNKSTKK